MRAVTKLTQIRRAARVLRSQQGANPKGLSDGANPKGLGDVGTSED